MVYQVYHLSILNAHLGEIIYSDSFNELKAFLKNRRNQRGSRGRQHLLFGCRCGFWAGRRKGWVLTLMVQNFMSPKCLYEGYVQFSNTNYCLFSFFKPLNPLISGWYLSALWLILFLSFSWVKFPPRSHAEPLCRWPAMSAGPRLMLRRLGDMKLIIFYHEKIGHFLSRYNWAHPIFGGLYLVYSSQPTTEKCTSDVQHRRRQVTGYALYLGYVRHSRDGDNPDLWENSLWKPSILAAMVIGDGSWHWLWFTWLYHKNRGIF